MSTADSNYEAHVRLSQQAKEQRVHTPAAATPRTDAVRLPINSHVLPADVVYADFARKLERENEQLSAEVARLKGMASWAHTCVHHTDEERERTGHRCPVCLEAQYKQSIKWALMERDRAERDKRDIDSAWAAYRSEWDAWKVRIDAERDRALERAAEAEAELAKMEQSYTDEVQRRFKDVDALSTALAKERGRAAIHESFCNDALALCEDTGIAGNIIAKMRELRSDAIDAAMKEEPK